LGNIGGVIAAYNSDWHFLPTAIRRRSIGHLELR
jgi:hypothetical protein